MLTRRRLFVFLACAAVGRHLPLVPPNHRGRTIIMNVRVLANLDAFRRSLVYGRESIRATTEILSKMLEER